MKKSKKEWISLQTDEEAENFINTANLAEYDWSKAEPINYEFENKTERITLRISKRQLENIKSIASQRGIKYQRFMREIM